MEFLINILTSEWRCRWHSAYCLR